MADHLWDSGVVMNDMQRKAIRLALTRNFQLIQGPPGLFIGLLYAIL